MRYKHLARPWPAAFLAAALLAAGCGDTNSGPNEPPGPDLTTPSGAMQAMEDHYGFRESDDAIALLAPDFRFYPAEPDSIPFLAPGATFWDRAQEVLILADLLNEERASWIDQVLLEVTTDRLSVSPDGMTAQIVGDVQLSILVGIDSFEKGRSKITFNYVRDGDGNYLLSEMREELALDEDGIPFTELTVGEHKASVLDGP